MIVTTSNLNQEYEIKGIVRFFLNSNIMKGQLGRDMSINEAIDYVTENVLSKQAEEKGGDAIIGFTIESQAAPGMAGSASYYIFYGTAVKIINK